MARGINVTCTKGGIRVPMIIIVARTRTTQYGNRLHVFILGLNAHFQGSVESESGYPEYGWCQYTSSVTKP